MGQSALSQVAGTGPVRWGAIAQRDDFILPVGTVTLLLADIEGSTRLWESDGPAMTAAVARYDGIVSDAVGRHAGVRPQEQGEGDSFVAAFARASDALACALDLQRSIAGIGFRVRVALHTGEVQLRDDANYIGTVVNRAARLREIGHGGQVLLSRAAYDLIAETVPDGVTLTDLGTHRLRDLARPEQVFQARHPDLADAFPPLRSLDTFPNNLPARLTTFIGRQQELVAVDRLLDGHRLVTLTGAGGCGKTSLALQAAAAAAPHWPDGVWFCDLAPLAEADLVPGTVAAALGLAEEPGRAPTETVQHHLRSRRALVVLDNCEHLIDACAALGDALLRGCAAVTLLATSREPLRVEGEVAWSVPSLSFPALQDPFEIETLGASDAVRLFVDRAVRVRPNFTVTNENAPAVAQVCRRLDGIPLAIELAAAMVRVLPPEQIAEGLDDRFRLLGAGSRTAMPRQQTLRASVDWSFDLLTEGERVLLRRLSVFAGGFTLDAAEAVCAAEPLTAYAILPTLSSLADKSLVVADDDGPAARFRMLETIRQYAAERLAESAEQDATRDGHLAFLLALATRLAPTNQNQATTVPALKVEYDNVRAALDWAAAAGRAEPALRLCGELGMFWYQAGMLPEGRRRIDAVLAAGGSAPAEARSRALVASALVSMMLGDIRVRARQELEQALALAREAGAQQTVRLALAWLAHVTIFSDPVAAKGLNDEAFALAQAAGDLEGTIHTSFNRILIDGFQGRLAPARALLRSRVAFVESGQMNEVPEAVVWEGQLSLQLGEYDVAEHFAREGLEMLRRIGNTYWQGTALLVLGAVRLARGDFGGAHGVAAELAAVSARSESAIMTSGAAGFAGLVAFAEGRLAEARLCIEDWRSHVGSLFALAPSGFGTLAEVHMGLGELNSAAAIVEEGLKSAAEFESTLCRAGVLFAQGHLERAKGEDERAESALHEALRLQVDAGDRPGAVDTLEAVAGIAAAQGSHLEAARLFGSAQALRDELGYVRFPVRQARYDADVALVRDCEDAWAEGAAMSLGEAVSYAQRGRGDRKRPSTGWASLTPTELEVVKLVAQGLSNAQVAQRLFVSPHTVKVHVSHVFSKLGMTNRAELASAVTRRGV